MPHLSNGCASLEQWRTRVMAVPHLSNGCASLEAVAHSSNGCAALEEADNNLCISCNCCLTLSLNKHHMMQS